MVTNTGRRRELRVVLAVLLPFVAAILAYGRFLDEWFFRDDFVWLAAAAKPDLSDFVRDAFTLPRGSTPYWRPAADFYFFGMYRLFGLNALPYHLINVLLHGVTGSLVVLVVARVTRSLAAGALAGMLFAVAPAYGQGVIWVSTVGTHISVLLSLACVLLVLGYLAEEFKPWVLAVAFVMFLGALLSMEGSIAVAVLLVPLGLAVRPIQNRGDARRLLLTLAPFVLLAVAYAVMQLIGERFGPSEAHAYDWRAAERLLVRLLWLSFPLASGQYGEWVKIARWIVLTAVSFGSVWAFTRGRLAAPALFAGTVVLVLPSSLLTVSFSYRWVYFAAVPWAGAIAALVVPVTGWLWDRYRLAGVAVASLVVLGLAAGLLPHDTHDQRGMAVPAEQMHEIKQVLERGCPQPASNLFILPLPFSDPENNFAGSVAGILRPEARMTRVRAEGLPLPGATDCVLEFRGPSFRAVSGDQYVPGRFWTVTLSYPCTGAVPWERAPLHKDNLATVVGPVQRVEHIGKVPILHIGAPRSFRVIIRSSFSGGQFPDAEAAYLNKTVCFRGVVRVASGSAYMIIDSPRAIVLGDEVEP
jgi:hypothetical protein